MPRILRTAVVFLFAAAVSFAATLPGAWIVELAGTPAASESERVRVRDQQRVLRRALAARRVVVTGAVEQAANALFVAMDEAEARDLALLPGVKRVEPVELFKPTLDHALTIQKVSTPGGAWEMLGGLTQAGRGMRIGIFDSGIEIRHPGFADRGFTTPEGFPRTTREQDRNVTNNKIIVARVYETADGESPLDQDGHGSGVAMIAAGVTNDGPRGPITGVAPAAWLGVYKVCCTSSGSIRSDRVLAALDDAIADGMNVVNMSFGSVGRSRPASSIYTDAFLQAVSRGVTIVKSAGNEGPERFAVDGAASLDEVLAVAAHDNERALIASSVAVEGLSTSLEAIPGDNVRYDAPPMTGRLTDIVRLDPSLLGCSAHPAGSLEGRIALIMRGTCTFEDKINNAAAAGAAGVIVYADEARPTDRVRMVMGSASLPATYVFWTDAVAVRALLKENDSALAQLRFYQAPISPDVVVSFSSRGPTTELRIKPDLSATGARIITAAQMNNPAGDLYDETGYLALSGTSFSAPIVTGAVALVKQGRPGLSEADYRSLLINSARPFKTPGASRPASPLATGVGSLDVPAALSATVAANPVAVSFGAGKASFEESREVTLKNVSAEAVTLKLSIDSPDEARPAVSPDSLTLAPGESGKTALRFAGSDLRVAAYEGVLKIETEGKPTVARVAYWYAVRGTEVASISIPGPPDEVRSDSIQTIYFYTLDAAGVPLTEVEPKVTAVSGGGSVALVSRAGDSYPGQWTARVQVGPTRAANVFRFEAAAVSRELTISVE